MQGAQLRANRKRVTAQIAEFKTKLAKDIKRLLDVRGLTQTEASFLTGEAPSQLSLICTGKLRGFSTDRLLRTRAMLGAEIHVGVTSSTRPTITYAFN
jgi:predicted XRE-type DNA-binding protein